MAVGDNVQVTEGSGKRLATGATYTENSQTVRDEKAILGEPYLASVVIPFAGISVATASDHILQIMAGASLNLRIRRIVIAQLATTSGSATSIGFLIHRLTTAGTGGTTVTPRLHDNGDSAACTAQTLPTSKGTEGSFLHRWAFPIFAAHPITAAPFEWAQLPNQKPIIVPAGTSNGMCIKISTGATGATVSGFVELDETPF